MVGEDARGLSSSVVSRLKSIWLDGHQGWSNRDLTGKHYLYLKVNGIHFHVRSDADRQCILVIIGTTERGETEYVTLMDGYRESEQSWTDVLLDLGNCGFDVAPALAIGDGPLGFWKAIAKVFPTTKHSGPWCTKLRRTVRPC